MRCPGMLSRKGSQILEHLLDVSPDLQRLCRVLGTRSALPPCQLSTNQSSPLGCEAGATLASSPKLSLSLLYPQNMPKWFCSCRKAT